MDRTAQEAALDELVNVREIAQMLGISRQRVDQLTRRPEFPKVAKVIASTRHWWVDDIREFEKTWDRTPGRRYGFSPTPKPVPQK